MRVKSLFVACVLQICILRVDCLSLTYMKNALAGSVTVSGFSSGGTMASQLTVAYSSHFIGVGMLSSVFYRCGYGGRTAYNDKCQKGDVPVSKGISDAKSYDTQNLIDPLTNLENQKVFLWMGSQDEFVTQDIRARTKEFYQAFISDTTKIKLVNMSATHEYPTDNSSYPTCPQSTTGYIGNCGYSGSYETLSFLLGPSIQRPAANIQLQPLNTFDQAEFTPGKMPGLVGLYTTGLFYVPTKCKNDTFNCRLHMFLHGCSLGLQAKIEEFIRGIGILEVAEQNNIIMVFPRATLQLLKNPMGCWDMFAANGDDYATKNGVQVLALRKMTAKILGETI